MRRIVLVAALSTVAVSTATAQQLKLSFNHGQVSVEASSVPARAILAEWGRVGGTKVVNGERITGAPLTLKLIDVPEAQALEIILRSVPGYMAAPRAGAPGASMYDRILVMPTSSGAALANVRVAPTAAPGPTGGTQRFIPPRIGPTNAPESVAEETPEEEPAPAQPVFTFPPAGQGAFRPGFRPPPGVGVSPGNADQTAPDPGTQGAPTSAPVPGMILQPLRPGQVRPPGL